MSLTVTATGTSPNQGIYLFVQVLTDAALAGTPAVLQAGGTFNGNITTTATGSFVLGAVYDWDTPETLTAISGSQILDQLQDATNNSTYAAFSTTAGTVTPGSTAVGIVYDAGTHDGYGVAAVEILASGGSIGFDGSTPADALNATGTTVTTASFSPPAGSLLVAHVILANGDGADDTAYTASMSDTRQPHVDAAGVLQRGRDRRPRLSSACSPRRSPAAAGERRCHSPPPMSPSPPRWCHRRPGRPSPSPRPMSPWPRLCRRCRRALW